MVRSDQSIDQEISSEKAWQKDKLTGNTGGDVERYQLPQNVQARLSFSGSERNSVFLKSTDGNFLNISGLTGMDLDSDSRCVAIIDLDRDGLNDFLFTNANDATLNIFHNRIKTDRQFVCVSVVGGNKSNTPSASYSSRDGVGALIIAETDSKSMIREVRVGEGLATQNSRQHRFGLGPYTQAKRVTVKWPSGESTIVEGLAAGSHVTIFENPEDAPGDKAYVVVPYGKRDHKPYAPSMEAIELAIPEPISLPENESAIQVITAMATWCESCKSHLTEIAHIANEFDSQIAIVGIAIDPADSQEKLDIYVSKHEPAYELLNIEAEAKRDLVRAVVQNLGHANVPFTVIRFPGGKIHSIQSGFPSISEIKKAISMAAQ